MINTSYSLTLPFISYGGSSLVISMFMMGIIVNIMKNGEKDLDFEYKNEKKLKKIKLPFLTKFYKKNTNK